MYILAALFLDGLLGDPVNILHPVAGTGKIIRYWEGRLYQMNNKRRAGNLFCAAVLLTTLFIVGAVLLCFSFSGWTYRLAVLYFLYSALAWRSLKDASLPIAESLCKGDIDTARLALSRVVGRDTQGLAAADIVRAALETIGENFIDGVFSVLFFMALGYFCAGSAGAVLAAWFFKTVNTMDSMVGYEDEKYQDFGRASARLDDLLNFIPARLGGAVALIAGFCAGFPFWRGLSVFLRDRKKHKSPNSAHGESVFAGLLGVRLGGGASYGGVLEERPVIGDTDFRVPEPFDILRAHKILDASTALSGLILFLLLEA